MKNVYLVVPLVFGYVIMSTLSKSQYSLAENTAARIMKRNRDPDGGKFHIYYKKSSLLKYTSFIGFYDSYLNLLISSIYISSCL